MGALAALSLGELTARAQVVPAVPAPAKTVAEESTDATSCTQDVSAPRSSATPTSTAPGQTPLDQSFECPEERVAEESRQGFRDTKFSAQLRSFYLDGNNSNGTESEAWTLGGSAGFETGYFHNLVAFGGTGYTSQPLYAPDDKDGTRLLKPGQEGYSVLGELYGRFILTDEVSATVGRTAFDTPYIGRFDVRMTPNTFEAAYLQGSFGGVDNAPELRFGAGYVDKEKVRDSDDFVSMATVAGAPPGVSRGVAVAGGIYAVGDLSVGAIEYYSADIINIAYTEVKDAFALTDRLRLKLAAQYSNQRSVGDNLLTGHEFSTEQFGAKAELAFAGALLTTAYTSTGSGANIRSPWNGPVGYTNGLIGPFNRAGENAWTLRAAYNFQYVKDLSAYAWYIRGTRPDLPTQYAPNEYDLNLQWKVTSGHLQGLTLVGIYARLSEAGPADAHTDQLRLILYYTPPWL